MGEEVSGPSNETEAEALQRRQVEALERIAEVLESVVGVDDRKVCVNDVIKTVRNSKHIRIR